MSDRSVRLRFSMVIAALLTTAWQINRSSCAGGVETEYVYATDPKFPEIPVDLANSPRRLELWLQALSRPERVLKIKAAEAIAREARRGDISMSSAIPALRENLADPMSSDRLVRQACAWALVALESRESADLLMQHVRSGGQVFAELVEPVLAEWEYSPMHEIWLSRLNDSKTPLRSTLLAIRAAARTNLKASIPRLREFALDRNVSPALRLAAAEALSRLQIQGLEPDAEQLRERRSTAATIDALVAVTLLSQHADPAATSLLLDFARHAEPAVVTIALRRLCEIAPDLVAPLNDNLIKHPDPGIRELTARILQRQQTAASIMALGQLLSDRHPSVRDTAKQELIAAEKKPELSGNARSVALRVLDADQPHGQAVAALVLGAVKHDPAADRLVELLDSPNADVQIHAAWALRRLLVPHTIPAVLAKFHRETAESMVSLPLETRVDYTAVNAMYVRLGHMIETLGLLQVPEALPTLLLYLPKPPQRLEKPVDIRLDTTWVPHLRLQALWAIGHICRDKPTAEITARLSEKMRELGDAEQVRAMAAISLARLHANEFLPELRSHYTTNDSYNDFKFGCAWAVHHLTGEPIPTWTFAPAAAQSTPSFLEPLGP